MFSLYKNRIFKIQDDTLDKYGRTQNLVGYVSTPLATPWQLRVPPLSIYLVNPGAEFSGFDPAFSWFFDFSLVPELEFQGRVGVSVDYR